LSAFENDELMYTLGEPFGDGVDDETLGEPGIDPGSPQFLGIDFNA
jgi:hypothetical protein